MSNSLRVDTNFFDDFFDEEPYETRRRRRTAGRHRRTRQSIRPNIESTTPHDSVFVKSADAAWEPEKNFFT